MTHQHFLSFNNFLLKTTTLSVHHEVDEEDDSYGHHIRLDQAIGVVEGLTQFTLPPSLINKGRRLLRYGGVFGGKDTIGVLLKAMTDWWRSRGQQQPKRKCHHLHSQK
jgi:hypothetical protein